MKFGQQLARELSNTNESFQAASIDYKQLKKSIKRIQNELASFGLNAELLKELLSVDDNAADVGIDDAAHVNRAPRSSKSSSSLRTIGSPETSKQKHKKGKRAQGRPRARAEYELAGTVDNPVPRIKLVFDSASSDSGSSSDEVGDQNGTDALYQRLVGSDQHRLVEISSMDADKETSDTLSDATPADSQTEDEFPDGDAVEDPAQRAEIAALISKMYGPGVPMNLVTPPGSPTMESPVTPKAGNGHAHHKFDGEAADVEEAVFPGPTLVLPDSVVSGSVAGVADDDADGEGETHDSDVVLGANIKSRRQNGHKKRRPHRHRKEITIELEYDSEFFTLLSQALASLTQLLQSEKQSFLDAVRALARSVQKTATPSKGKNDLYAWREVFSLWVEAGIFESDSERNRGERSIQEVEKRLNWFVDQIARRKLAKQMRNKESRVSLERFIELNQELLQLKRIGFANREAARKILKKHDKRLGLSASQEFPGFVAGQQQLIGDGPEDATSQSVTLKAKEGFMRQATSKEMTTLVFAGLTTLPHVLLTSFTDILLPIIPQIDDYSCLICSDLAWRPILLDCGHRFCVRCLVKMQKRGQDACPACRAPVVMKASKENLDTALSAFQRQWFPKEIKAKEKENKKEIEQEVAEELGMEPKCIIA